MAGIAGIGAPDKSAQVETMLNTLKHRGKDKREIVETESATIGAVWSSSFPPPLDNKKTVVQDKRNNNHFARATVVDSEIVLERDQFGVAPLYWGRNQEGLLCFASEVKALLVVTNDINVVPPKQNWVTIRPHTSRSLLDLTRELRRRLENAIQNSLTNSDTGCWLSGGIDSSAIAALARLYIPKLHTFASGLPDAPDLECARAVAYFIGSVHHEIVFQPEEMFMVLPEVIYHLESFDAPLVRSSIANYLAGRTAAEYVSAILTGEGADELFAGYDYLKRLNPELLNDELITLTRNLDNTALQRVDRCSAAHGLIAHLPFLNSEVAFFALALAPELKIRNGVEKWILRQAVVNLLPHHVLIRPKAKFWQGAGINEVLAEFAEEKVSDRDFRRERLLPDGSLLNSKEELMFYRIFCEWFGGAKNLSWVGRSK